MRRRDFLHSLATATGGLALASACGGGPDPTPITPPPPSPPADPFAGGTLIETIDFAGEGDAQLETPLGQGLDGRLYTDLTKLTPDNLITPNEHFYIRTRYPDRLMPSGPWKIRIGGHVAQPFELELDELLPLVEPMGTHLLECSGNGDFGRFGLLSAANWSGIPLSAVIDRASPAGAATRVRIAGFDDHSQPSMRSTPGASWIFTFEDLREAFLATEMNGAPLPPDHGAPVRLFVPGWYGCTNAKWVDEITFVDDDEPATSQMMEFASRTHQNGTPELARDYLPARMDVTAMPVRVEKWAAGGRTLYRIVGIMWGGTMPVDKLIIKIGDAQFERVAIVPPPSTHHTWTLWEHPFEAPGPGTYDIELQIDDPSIPKKRLDSKFYLRTIVIA